MTTIKLVFTLSVIFAIVWFVLRPLVRTWQQQPDPEAFMPKLPDTEGEELQIPEDPAGRRKPTRNQMIDELRADPTKTAMVLKQWIGEKQKPERKGRKPSG